MRLLLDENFPMELVRDFPAHECAHVAALGWNGIQNGDLLDKAEAFGFDVLLTFDKGIPRDHDIPSYRIAVYVLKPDGQGSAATRALVGDVLMALNNYQPGQGLTITNRTGRRRS